MRDVNPSSYTQFLFFSLLKVREINLIFYNLRVSYILYPRFCKSVGMGRPHFALYRKSPNKIKNLVQHFLNLFCVHVLRCYPSIPAVYNRLISKTKRNSCCCNNSCISHCKWILHNQSVQCAIF